MVGFLNLKNNNMGVFICLILFGSIFCAGEIFEFIEYIIDKFSKSK